MIELFLQTFLIALCGLSLKIHLWKRSITTCIYLFSLTLYMFTKDYIGIYANLFPLVGVLVSFIRAMFKPSKDKLWYQL